MKKINLPVCTLIFLAGCAPIRHQQAYYVSPFHGNSQEYHALPLTTDTATTAIFIRGGYSGGTANDNSTDHFYSGDLSAYLAHNSGPWQFYGGLNASLGNYKMGSWDSAYTLGGLFLPAGRTAPPGSSQQLNGFSGPKTFGSMGFSGGINIVVPVGQGEWRALGIETALHYEAGDYLNFRKNVPDSLVTLLVRSPFYGTFGLSSEIVGRTNIGESGFRVAAGWALGPKYHLALVHDDLDDKTLDYGWYMTMAFHVTFGQYTSYIQSEFGAKASSIHLGLAYRFNKPRLPPKRRYREEIRPYPKPIHPE
jgi:hypothetical protein